MCHKFLLFRVYFRSIHKDRSPDLLRQLTTIEVSNFQGRLATVMILSAETVQSSTRNCHIRSPAGICLFPFFCIPIRKFQVKIARGS